MLDVPEYDLQRPSTLTVLREADVISPSEAAWFRRRLERIAGKTLMGQPRLRMVWGATHCDEMSTDKQALKYLDFNYGGEQFGERRFIIEVHRSPEFLEASGRYQITTRQDTDGTKLLKEIQPEGCYDYWLRLERENLTYHPPDDEALKAIEIIWQFEQNPDNRRNALEQGDYELDRRRQIHEQRQQTQTRVHFTSQPVYFDGNRVLPLTR